MSLINQAFIRAHARTQSDKSASHINPPHLPMRATSDDFSGIENSVLMSEPIQVQEAGTWSALPEESYFRVDVGHTQAARIPRNTATDSVPRTQTHPTQPMNAPTLPAQTKSESHFPSNDSLSGSVHQHLNAMPGSHGPASIADQARRSAVVSHTLTAYDFPTESPAVQGRWKAPLIDEPEVFFPRYRDSEASLEFARAKAETLATESAAKPSTKTPLSDPMPLLREAVTHSSKPFEPLWEVDAFEFSETVVKLFGNARLMKSIGSPLDVAVSQGLRSILITSDRPRAGRTTVAIGVAMSAAAAGLRVALVDGGQSEETLADTIRVDVQQGWLEAVRDEVPLDDVAVHSIEDQLTVLPSLQSTSSPMLTPASEDELGQVITELRKVFDLVIIDGGVWGEGGELIQTMSSIDAAIIVVDQRRRDNESLANVQQSLKLAGVIGLGIVENFT